MNYCEGINTNSKYYPLDRSQAVRLIAPSDAPGLDIDIDEKAAARSYAGGTAPLAPGRWFCAGLVGSLTKRKRQETESFYHYRIYFCQ